MHSETFESASIRSEIRASLIYKIFRQMSFLYMILTFRGAENCLKRKGKMINVIDIRYNKDHATFQAAS